MSSEQAGDTSKARDLLGAALSRELARIARPQPGLYAIATPIGNLVDITLRALHTLAEADLVLCEDTRITRRLLERYDLSPPLLSYHEHNAPLRRPQIMERLASGEVVALVSDAGTPLVSDPGYRLLRDAQEAGYSVHAVPGASAVLAALVASALPTDRFWFEGFLPAKAAARRRRIEELVPLEATLVIFESPRRLTAALTDLAERLGEREAAIGRELTKRFETVTRATLPQLASAFAEASQPKGEIVIVVAGNEGAEPRLDEAQIDRRLEHLLATFGTREAAAQLAAETGLKRRDLYQRALRLSGDTA